MLYSFLNHDTKEEFKLNLPYEPKDHRYVYENKNGVPDVILIRNANGVRAYMWDKFSSKYIACTYEERQETLHVKETNVKHPIYLSTDSHEE